MKCPSCQSESTNIRTAIRQGKLVTSCEHCSRLLQAQPLAAKNRREQQKKDFRKDITQPADGRAYAQAYPERARELWGDDTVRLLS